MVQQTYREIQAPYPESWEEEYRKNGIVSIWCAEYPDLFHPGAVTSTRLGTLDLFAQYTLMYLLRKESGTMSITWFYLADTSKESARRDRTLAAWTEMRKWMGAESFKALRSALLDAGFSSFKGEPDLFCWHPETGAWFFAEAKHGDRLIPSQLQWFQVCREALGDAVDIRVYTLTPIATNISDL